MKYKRIVINEPHASIEGLYDEHLGFWDIDEEFFNDVVLKWTDWHTDYLFHGNRIDGVRIVRFSYSRFIVDAERLWDDPLEREGQGKASCTLASDDMCATYPMKTEVICWGCGINTRRSCGTICAPTLFYLTSTRSQAS